MQTRGIVLEEYGAIAKELYKMGHKAEAKIISGLAKDVAGKSFTTKAQAQYDQATRKQAHTIEPSNSPTHPPSIDGIISR